ncbi:MAG: DUF484 family protein [Proteobacteria bacterium]|nr:MAG: DUF484 family protein [Pseudomonadota bacterium]
MTESISTKDIVAYLQDHPTFFADHPTLLQELSVPDEQGQLQQMATYQAKTLQQQNHQLKNQIKQLIHHAKINETLMNRVYELLVELAVCDSDRFLNRFIDFVQSHFASDYFKLSCRKEFLPQQPSHYCEALTAAQKSQFTVFQHQSEPLSGRLPQSQIEAMFGIHKDIRSAIVMPLGPQAQYGLLGFASCDEDKFMPHAASDILQKLGHIVSHFFAAQSHPQQAKVKESNVQKPNNDSSQAMS